MKTKIKVGDLVRCIEPYDGLEFDSVHTVEAINYDQQYLCIRQGDGLSSYAIRRFEVADCEPLRICTICGQASPVGRCCGKDTHRQGPSQQWQAELLQRMREAGLEDDGGCSVGGMAVELGVLSIPHAMVLEYQPELTHSIWIDYVDEQIQSRQELIDALKVGVKEGKWVAWRLIRVEQEVFGNE